MISPNIVNAVNPCLQCSGRSICPPNQAPFVYQKMFESSEDNTRYVKLTSDFVSVTNFKDKEILEVSSAALSYLSEVAFKEISHYLRTAHLEQLSKILSDSEASSNDKYVAHTLLQNAVVAAEGVLPSCQDTGTAIIMGKKGQYVFTDEKDEIHLSEGVYNSYTRLNLRYSQNAPLNMYDEVNTGSNLPAQIDIYSVPGNEYHFLFMAKGGGSANKTYLYQETKALLNPKTLINFLMSKIKTLGTAACPPYHIAIVVGGTSAELCLKTVKLASAKYYDNLPTTGNKDGRAFREISIENELNILCQKSGIGAQFGGKYFAHDIRVVRLPRHGASCPVGIGVSCSADRQMVAKITKEGIFIEELEHNPLRFIPLNVNFLSEGDIIIDLNQPMPKILKALTQYPILTRFLLNGPMVVGRDIAHAKLVERLDRGDPLPEYFKQHMIYYAGPAKSPVNYSSGSFGPTTAGRMDSYIPRFMELGGSMISLAKGNRSSVVTESCKKYGGFYLGSIGGPAAILAKKCIYHVECLEYPELGMEAIWKIMVRDFPAFLIVDDKGNDFFNFLS